MQKMRGVEIRFLENQKRSGLKGSGGVNVCKGGEGRGEEEVKRC